MSTDQRPQAHPVPSPAFAAEDDLEQAASSSAAASAAAASAAAAGAPLWRALLLALLGMLLFALLFNLVIPSLGANLPPMQLAALGLLLALIPSALWLTFFAAFDRRAPEPKALVIAVFAGGAVLCAALRLPLLSALAAFDAAAGPWWRRLAEEILVVGVFEMALVFVAVRALVFDRAEFDERVDGVIYGVAAGLGLATIINFAYVLAHGGVDLDVGSLRMVVNTLAYASAAGVLGYFIGQARFERVPWHYLPGGLLLAATLTGALFFALEPAATSLQPRNPWVDLLLAAGVAALALVAVFVLIARAHEETQRLHRDEARPQPPRPLQPWLAGNDPYAATPIAAGRRHFSSDFPEADPLAAVPPLYPESGAPAPSRPEKGNPYGAGS